MGEAARQAARAFAEVKRFRDALRNETRGLLDATMNPTSSDSPQRPDDEDAQPPEVDGGGYAAQAKYATTLTHD